MVEPEAKNSIEVAVVVNESDPVVVFKAMEIVVTPAKVSLASISVIKVLLL
jgi:hypothetical protein